MAFDLDEEGVALLVDAGGDDTARAVLVAHADVERVAQGPAQRQHMAQQAKGAEHVLVSDPQPQSPLRQGLEGCLLYTSVMGQDQRRRVVRQGALDHLARVDAGAIDAALEQHLERQDPVPRVEEQAGEHLVLLVAQARLEIVAHRLRALQYRIATQADVYKRQVKESLDLPVPD